MSTTPGTPFPSSDEPRSPTMNTNGTMAGMNSGGSATSHERSGTGSHDGQELMDQVAQGAHETIDQLADQTSPHLQRLQEDMNAASEAVHEGANHLREAGDAWAASLRDTVRENPLAALAAAVAVGMLVSRLSRR